MTVDSILPALDLLGRQHTHTHTHTHTSLTLPEKRVGCWEVRSWGRLEWK